MTNRQKEIMSNKIVLRKYYAICVRLISPLGVSSGENDYTDADVLRDASGRPFVPGTSLAGAFRNALGMEKDRKCILGYSEGQDGRMSSLCISDLYFDEDPKVAVSVRDGVALTEEKTVDNKFDMEIIETGAKGTIFFHYVQREKENKEDFECAILQVLKGLQNGEIRLGANKTRGFGRLKVVKAYQKTFCAENVQDWLNFLKAPKCLGNYEEMAENLTGEPSGQRYTKLRIPLQLTGGISIRRYSARPGEADFEHITCGGKPVIPGTSWNGAIRADAREILNSLGYDDTEGFLKRWFGNIDRGSARQSRVVIGESVLEGAVELEMTRNQVNRFDASTKDGALYSERACFCGSTWLEIMVQKGKRSEKKRENGTEAQEGKEYLALLGLLRLVILDIQKGYVAVGGQTAVGRGIFQEDPSQEAEYGEAADEKACMSALYALTAGEEGNRLCNGMI